MHLILPFLSFYIYFFLSPQLKQQQREFLRLQTYSLSPLKVSHFLSSFLIQRFFLIFSSHTLPLNCETLFAIIYSPTHLYLLGFIHVKIPILYKISVYFTIPFCVFSLSSIKATKYRFFLSFNSISFSSKIFSLFPPSFDSKIFLNL
jgi:hypothetical protein